MRLEVTTRKLLKGLYRSTYRNLRAEGTTKAEAEARLLAQIDKCCDTRDPVVVRVGENIGIIWGDETGSRYRFIRPDSEQHAGFAVLPSYGYCSTCQTIEEATDTVVMALCQEQWTPADGHNKPEYLPLRLLPQWKQWTQYQLEYYAKQSA